MKPVCVRTKLELPSVSGAFSGVHLLKWESTMATNFLLYFTDCPKATEKEAPCDGVVWYMLEGI